MPRARAARASSTRSAPTRIGGSPEEDAAHGSSRAGSRRPGSRSRWTPPATPSAAGARPSVWIGSHLDSVPNGGRFDGALGVVAAIEAAGAHRRAARGRRLPRRGARLRGQPRVRRAPGACRARSSSSTSSRARCSSGAGAPLGIVTAIVGQAQRRGRLRGSRRPRRDDADGRAPTTRSWRRRSSCCASRAAAPPGDGRHGRPARGRAGRDERRARARDASRSTPAPRRRDELDALVAAIGFEPSRRARARRDERRAARGPSRRRARRARARLRRRPRRGDPRGAPASRPGCSSSAA